MKLRKAIAPLVIAAFASTAAMAEDNTQICNDLATSATDLQKNIDELNETTAEEISTKIYESYVFHAGQSYEGFLDAASFYTKLHLSDPEILRDTMKNAIKDRTITTQESVDVMSAVFKNQSTEEQLSEKGKSILTLLTDRFKDEGLNIDKANLVNSVYFDFEYPLGSDKDELRLTKETKTILHCPTNG